MRIEGDRIGALDARKQVLRRWRERGKTSVGAVHVQPQAVAFGDIGHIREGIERAGIHRPGVGDDAGRPEPGVAVRDDAALQFAEIDSECVVGRDGLHVVRADAEQPGGLADRKMSFFGDVDAQRRVLSRAGPGELGIGLRARGRKAREVRHGSAADQESRGTGVVAEERLEPVDHHVLDFGARGSRAPRGDVGVQCRSEKIADRRDGGSRRRDVSEEPGMSVVPAERIDYVPHGRERFAKGRGFVGERL